MAAELPDAHSYHGKDNEQADLVDMYLYFVLVLTYIENGLRLSFDLIHI